MNEHRQDWDRFDDLSAAERREALRHALSCAACRDRLVEDDPTRIFSLLSLRPVPESVLDDVSRNVSAAIRSGNARPASTRIAAWAASLLLAAVATGLLLVGDRGPRNENLGRTAIAMHEEVPVPGAARLELLSSPGQAEVVDLTVGETQLVMIFDEDVEL